MPVILALERLREENYYEFKAAWATERAAILIPFLKKKKKRERKERKLLLKQ